MSQVSHSVTVHTASSALLTLQESANVASLVKRTSPNKPQSQVALLMSQVSHSVTVHTASSALLTLQESANAASLVKRTSPNKPQSQVALSVNSKNTPKKCRLTHIISLKNVIYSLFKY